MNLVAPMSYRLIPKSEFSSEAHSNVISIPYVSKLLVVLDGRDIQTGLADRPQRELSLHLGREGYHLYTNCTMWEIGQNLVAPLLACTLAWKLRLLPRL
jgi:hypothetical protein